MTKKPRTFAEHLQHHRERLGLSVVDFAELLGVSRNQIYKYLDGTDFPKLGTFLRIADKLGVSTEELRDRG